MYNWSDRRIESKAEEILVELMAKNFSKLMKDNKT